MEYKIIHEDAFPLVECKLQQGETLKAESDAMVSMTGNLDIRGSMDRNILGGLARRFLAGESFFFQTITASRGSGTVWLCSLDDKKTITEDVRSRINSLLNEELKKAIDIIQNNRNIIDALVDALMNKNKLSENEISEIITSGSTR